MWIGIVTLALAHAAATMPSPQPEPTVAATIDPSHRLIEGIATDGRTIWVSSVLDRAVLACRLKCRKLTVLPPPLHPMGMAWDPARKMLWIAADCPKLPAVVDCDRGALLALDASGRIRARLRPEADAFHPGDVSVGSAVYVSDSQNGSVYRVIGKSLAAVVKPGIGKSAQGTAETTGGRLIFADYGQGVGQIDLATGARSIIPRDDGKPLRGIDGLVRCGDSFFAIYNGTSPGSLLQLEIGDTIKFEKIVEGAPLTDPTQLATDGRRLLMVANAGWEAASKGETTRSEAPAIVQLPVSCDRMNESPAAGVTVNVGPSVEDASWLAGRWVGEGLGGTMEETWSRPAGGQMVGHFQLVANGEPQFYEIMLLDRQPSGLRLRVKHFNSDFTAWEDKQEWHSFEPIGVAPNVLRFDGLTIVRKGDDLSISMAIKSKSGATQNHLLKLKRAPF